MAQPLRTYFWRLKTSSSALNQVLRVRVPTKKAIVLEPLVIKEAVLHRAKLFTFYPGVHVQSLT